jgi:hypothetical protein
MPDMMRKQVYILKRQQALLKRLSKLRGLSESEIIRSTIDREAFTAAAQPPFDSRKALDEIIRFALSLRECGATGKPYKWNREEL